MKGVIVMSAGNPAKAVACHAEQLRIPATIVMSKNTPNVKVKDTKSFDARVVLSGDNLDEAAAHAQQIAESEHLTFVHPYNDVDIIAGQGTVALETAGPARPRQHRRACWRGCLSRKQTCT